MGDHRCSIKIEMEFHGVKDTLDTWINWVPTEVEGVDSRVIDFIRDVYDRGIEVYYDQMRKAEEERNRAETEARERRELERLKAIYEPDGGPRAAQGVG